MDDPAAAQQHTHDLARRARVLYARQPAAARLDVEIGRQHRLPLADRGPRDHAVLDIVRCVPEVVPSIIGGRGVAFWLDKAYTHLDSGLFDESDIAEVEELAAAYYDRLDAAEQDGAEGVTDVGNGSESA